MNEQRSLLENLAVELIYLVFEYLAPHDLLYAFSNLNKQFTAMLVQQPLYLPNNRHMHFNVYLDYINSIIPKHVSQIVYLHLSERYAPHAIRQFISEVPLKTLNWPALKAVTIEDVPFYILSSLLNHSSFLSNVYSLSYDIGHGRYCYFYHDYLADFNVVIPLLNGLPELRSLYLCMNNSRLKDSYTAEFSRCSSPLIIHQNLHTLTIIECSLELFDKLLNEGHLPQLHRLRAALSCTYDDSVVKSYCSTPLKQSSVLKLRYVSIIRFIDVAWLLPYFGDLQRHSQLKWFNISGYVRLTKNSNFPHVTELRQWLLLNKSKEFKFQMKLSTNSIYTDKTIQKSVLAEYGHAIGDDSLVKHGKININYRPVSFSDSNNEEDNNILRSNMIIKGQQSNNDNMKEMLIVLDNVKGNLPKRSQAIRQWPYLRKIAIQDDNRNENSDITGKGVLHLLHIAQRSPQLRELYIIENSHCGRILSLNVELGILLTSQLEVLYFTEKNVNCSLADLVQIINALFSHSSSSPILKQLRLDFCEHPSSWFAIDHFVEQIQKILNRFPALIHLTLHCTHGVLFFNKPYDLSELAQESYIRLLLSRSNMNHRLSYRNKSNSFDIWL